MNLSIRGLTLSFLITLVSIFSLAATSPPEKLKIGFLVHDLVADRWKKDVENFTREVEQLGGEVILKNGLGDAATQVTQGKSLIDEGIKVIAVVAQDGNVLAELVDYANKKGATIIAYDRMILNCDLHYYISYNSIKVGEQMADYALKLKPKGNYVILNGPASDNNAILVRKGVMNQLQKHIDSGNIKIIFEKEMDSWYGLSAMIAMEEFNMNNTVPIDVLITGSDDLSSGALDAFPPNSKTPDVVTGQDASLEACRNIVRGKQSMTVYKSIKTISSEAAVLSMKIAKGENVKHTTTLNNGKREVPSILFNPVVVDKTNFGKTVIADGHLKAEDLK